MVGRGVVWHPCCAAVCCCHAVLRCSDGLQCHVLVLLAGATFLGGSQCPALRTPLSHPAHPGTAALRFAGDVRVNWRSGCKASSDVKAGDVISVAGKGRVEIKAASITKKGKWSVQMVRYL